MTDIHNTFNIILGSVLVTVGLMALLFWWLLEVLLARHTKDHFALAAENHKAGYEEAYAEKEKEVSMKQEKLNPLFRDEVRYPPDCLRLPEPPPIPKEILAYLGKSAGTPPNNLDMMDTESLVKLRTDINRKLKSASMWSMQERPNWEEYFSFIAYAVSQRGSCMRRQVGAVFVDSDNNILSTGYNGKGAGLANCSDNPCSAATAGSGTNLDGCEAVHAEVNALLRCKDPQKIHSVYVTVSPCVHCVNILLNTSAKRIVFTEEYAHNEESKRRWLAAGREWTYLKPGE